MMTVLGCVVHEHNIWLVILATFLCVAGSWVAARLFLRTTVTTGLQRLGWYFLTALAAGVAIWCTHFVAMLGFDSDVPVGFDPVLTIVSLLIAVVGSTAGFVLAGARFSRFTPALGGAVVGAAIAAMHYTGMMAYRVQGIVSWEMYYLAASIVLSVGLSAMALHYAMQPMSHAGGIMAGVLALAIVSLHFTGMTAFRVQPMWIDGSFANPEALETLALAIAGMAVIIIAAGLASYLIDDSARAETVERLRVMALNDALTALPNRTNFNERLDHEIKLANRYGRQFALIGIDLNRFKEINDIRGHTVGDEVLRVLGRRMMNLIQEEKGEYIARIGGDEFTAISRTVDTGGLADFLNRLRASLFKPILVGDSEISPGASIGVAIYPTDAKDKENLINNADLAMYRAKASMTEDVCFYERGMDEVVKTRRCIAADLREALTRGQFTIHYQVQTSVSTGEIRGYEALLRWNHPEHGFIPPSEFIPIAEQNGLILQIGEWVLREACATVATWKPPYKVAVNLSPVQLAAGNLPNLIMEVLMQTGLPPDRLEVELTESTIFADRERALHTLRQIRNLGVSVALDDFGTGYSSLDTLRSFHFDKIKLDRSFMSECTGQGRAIVRAMLALGRSLNVPVLAEGIETQDQLSMLGEEGCDEVQGFLLGRPMPLNDIVVLGQIALGGDDPADYPERRARKIAPGDADMDTGGSTNDEKAEARKFGGKSA